MLITDGGVGGGVTETPTTNEDSSASETPAEPDTGEELTPEIGEELTREEAAALRASFDPEERARIENTVASLLSVLGKVHAMSILSAFAFADGPLRFSDLESDLDVPPNTLSTRLHELTQAGLLTRRAYDEMPPRVEYEPTEKGKALFPVFAHLHHWAIEYDV
ncbi:DNA-binding transcriptional regulator, HxlR family [Haloferax larsenii]|uniref:DNA-binding transcriptional regulator, HxlR family n=1 Tax=Haloferax larsenii TaxID=302484 RepID=A0A1H7NTT1_HALLR|nr:DNA-binding transcriptional regulator, HxlR family [Haloferax larsenii]